MSTFKSNILLTDCVLYNKEKERQVAVLHGSTCKKDVLEDHSQSDSLIFTVFIIRVWDFRGINT